MGERGEIWEPCRRRVRSRGLRVDRLTGAGVSGLWLCGQEIERKVARARILWGRIESTAPSRFLGNHFRNPNQFSLGNLHRPKPSVGRVEPVWRRSSCRVGSQAGCVASRPIWPYQLAVCAICPISSSSTFNATNDNVLTSTNRNDH